MTLKTTNQVLRERPEYKRLIKAVIKRIGKESVTDILNHGISGGFNGFIYYSDTVNFFDKYQTEIQQLTQELANDLGEDQLAMIASFNCLFDKRNGKNVPMYSQTEIGKVLFGNAEVRESFDDAVQIANALAWFAAEEVCRFYEQ